MVPSCSSWTRLGPTEALEGHLKLSFWTQYVALSALGASTSPRTYSGRVAQRSLELLSFPVIQKVPPPHKPPFFFLLMDFSSCSCALSPHDTLSCFFPNILFQSFIFLLRLSLLKPETWENFIFSNFEYAFSITTLNSLTTAWFRRMRQGAGGDLSGSGNKKERNVVLFQNYVATLQCLPEVNSIL